MIYVLLYLYTICGEFYKKPPISQGFFLYFLIRTKHLKWVKKGKQKVI